MATRKRAHWMNEKDDIILEYLRSISPSAEPPRVIYFNIFRRPEELRLEQRTGGGFSYDTLRNRISKLEGLGLVGVAREKGGYREITDVGVGYLDGEVDAATLEDE